MVTPEIYYGNTLLDVVAECTFLCVKEFEILKSCKVYLQ